MKSDRLILLAAAVLFLAWLGGHDLWAPDEPYFAEGAREMIVDGHWLVPHVNGVVTTDKPPLFFWLIALFSLPLGQVTSWSARLPSALAALGTLALTVRLGRRFFNARTAAIAGAVLATTFLFWEKARWSQTDALLCMLIWTALSAFEAFRADDLDGRQAGLIFWAAAALAVLTKGPVGLLLPVGISVTVLVTDRDLRRWRRFAPLLGPLLFAVLIGGWMALAMLVDDSDYSVWGALREHFVDRGIHGMHHKQPPWYFIEVLPIVLLPWTGLVPGAFLLAWRRRRRQDRFLLVVTLFVVIFFTISTEKRELYALPAVPAFALLVAGFVASVLDGSRSADAKRVLPGRGWAVGGQAAIGALLSSAAIALAVAGARVELVPRWMGLALAAVLFVTGLMTLILAWRRRLGGAVLTLAGGVALIYLFVAAAIYPTLEPRKSARPFALTIKSATEESRAAGLPIVAYALDNLPEPFAFYSDGVYTRETNEPEVLERHLARPDEVLAVVNGGRLDPLSRHVLDRTWVVAETRLGRKDVLLVANHRRSGARPLLAGDDPAASGESAAKAP